MLTASLFWQSDSSIEKTRLRIKEVDRDGNGQLAFKEFVMVMTDKEVDIERHEAQLAAEDAAEPAVVRAARAAQKAEAAEAEAELKAALTAELRRAWGTDYEEKMALAAEYGRRPLLHMYVQLSVMAGDLAKYPPFINFMTFVICLAGVLVGINTDLAYPGRGSVPTYPILEALDSFILIVFSFEVIVKIVAEGREPLIYFVDPWNRFDFFIVFMCDLFSLPGLPKIGAILAMLRLLRLLRVLKLIKAVPQLRIMIEAFLKGFSSIFFILILLFVFYFIYANIGMLLFAKNDPFTWGNLQYSMLSLYRIATFDSWSDIL